MQSSRDHRSVSKSVRSSRSRGRQRDDNNSRRKQRTKSPFARLARSFSRKSLKESDSPPSSPKRKVKKKKIKINKKTLQGMSKEELQQLVLDANPSAKKRETVKASFLQKLLPKSWSQRQLMTEKDEMERDSLQKNWIGTTIHTKSTLGLEDDESSLSQASKRAASPLQSLVAASPKDANHFDQLYEDDYLVTTDYSKKEITPAANPNESVVSTVSRVPTLNDLEDDITSARNKKSSTKSTRSSRTIRGGNTKCLRSSRTTEVDALSKTFQQQSLLDRSKHSKSSHLDRSTSHSKHSNSTKGSKLLQVKDIDKPTRKPPVMTISFDSAATPVSLLHELTEI